jgi:exopolysaccharide biosynthesis polyprenyl glycosylphosphotransferase
MLSAALLITLTLRYRGDELEYYSRIHAGPFAVIFVFWVLAFYITNLYERRLLRNNLEFYSNLLRAGVFATLLSIALFYLAPLDITPRANLALFSGIFAILIVVSRGVINDFLFRRSKRPVIIVGASAQSMELAKFISQNPQLGYRLKCVVDIMPSMPELVQSSGIPVRHGIQEARAILESEWVDIVVVSPEAYKIPELIDLFYRSIDKKITFRNLASFYEHVTGRVPLGAINQIWFLENLTESSKRMFELIKRVTDIILSLILGIPFVIALPIIALAIKISSPGQVFYRQIRKGWTGKTFEIIKIRTMQQGAEDTTGAIWAQTHDPRITRLGRFLRESRIDEFPQLWNIFRGEMSFVGPRAERPEFHEKLKRDIPFYEERYLIKPGLSGWAQINYPYGASVQDAAEKLQYDLYYIKNRSLLLDLGIILKTINISVRQAGR